MKKSLKQKGMFFANARGKVKLDQPKNHGNKVKLTFSFMT